MPHRLPQNLPRELLLLGVLATLWGSSYPLIKVALATLPPLTLIALRVSLAAALLAIVMRLQGARFPRDRGVWRMLLVQAFFNSIGAWTLLAWGEQFVGSALAGVLNSTSPIFVFFITLLLTRHEAATAARLAGALSGVLGVGLIVGVDALRGFGEQIAGQLAVVASAALYGCAAVYGRRLAHISAASAAAGTMLWAAAVLVPLSLVLERPWLRQPSAASVCAAVVLGLVCTGIALLLYFRLVRTLGSMGVASQSYLRAGVSVLLGTLVLGERIGPSIGVGLAAVIVGVALINFPARPRQGKARHLL